MYAFDAVLGALADLQPTAARRSRSASPHSELIIDFEVDPDDPDHIIASSQRRIFRSTDGGKRWRPVQAGDGTRLAWPVADALYRADRDGSIEVSDNGGDSFAIVGKVAGEPYKFKTLGARHLYLALSDGAILETSDGGKRWKDAFRP